MSKAEKTIRRESLVLRIVWMLLFLLVWQIAVPLLAIIVVAQLLYRLFFGAPSAHFMRFGDSLSQYLAQMGRFAVFNTDAKPWPVADWPQAHVANGEAAHDPQAKHAAANNDAANAVAAATEKSATSTAVEVNAADAEVAEVAEELTAQQATEVSDQQTPEEPKQ